MSTASRLTAAGLILGIIAVILGTTVVPTHVTFGAGSLRCGTVLRPERGSELASFCGPAGAHHLRAALIVGTFLTALAIVPVLVQWRRPGPHPALWTIWAVAIVLAAIAGVTGLGMVKYAPRTVFFDL